MNLKDFTKQLLLYSGKSISETTEIIHLERFIEKFKPKPVGVNLIRIGGDGDGAYLLPDDFLGISTCFSPGVDIKSTFEEELANRYGINSFMVDYSVSKPSVENKLLNFDKRFLGNKNDDKYIRLEEWVNNNAKDNTELILQMDIEGAEYEVIIDTPSEIFKKFRIMAIEFHFLDMIFNKSAFRVVEAVFDKICSDFTVAHIHPNNSRPIFYKSNIAIPELLEFTFLRNDRVKMSSEKLTFPHELDQPSVPRRPSRHLPKCWWS